MDEYIQIISNVGFPIAITLYLLTRFEKKLEKLDKSIMKLEDTINELRLQIKSK